MITLRVKQKAPKERYLDAISACTCCFGKKTVKDICVNGFNANIMRRQKANHGLQICIDHFAFAHYICGYLTLLDSASEISGWIKERKIMLKAVTVTGFSLDCGVEWIPSFLACCSGTVWSLLIVNGVLCSLIFISLSLLLAR